MAGGPRSGSVARRLRRAANVREDEVGRIRLIALAFAALEAGRGLGEVGVNTLVLSRLPRRCASVALHPPRDPLADHRARLRSGARACRESPPLRGHAGHRRRPAGGRIPPAGRRSRRRADRLAHGHGRRCDRGNDQLDRGDVVARCPPGTAPLPRLHGCGDRRLPGRQPPCRADRRGRWSTSADRPRRHSVRRSRQPSIAVLAQRHVGARWIPQRTARRSIAADVRVGFDEVRGSPLLRLVAAAYILLAILMFSVSFPYLRAARAAYPDEAELARILGIIAATITGISFVVSLGLADRFYRRFGIAAAALLLPLVYLGGFGLWVVSFSFATAARVHDRPAGHPARHLERGLERVLQRPAVDPSSPGDRVHGRRARADRHRAGRHPAVAVHEPSRAGADLLARLGGGGGLRGDRRRDPAPVCRCAAADAPKRPWRADPRGRTGTRRPARGTRRARRAHRRPACTGRGHPRDGGCPAGTVARDRRAPGARRGTRRRSPGRSGGGGGRDPQRQRRDGRGPRARARGILSRVTRDRRRGGAGGQPRGAPAAPTATRRRPACVVRRRPITRGPGRRDVCAREHDDTESGRRPRGRAQRPSGTRQGRRRHDAREPSRGRSSGGRPPRHDRRRPPRLRPSPRSPAAASRLATGSWPGPTTRSRTRWRSAGPAWTFVLAGRRTRRTSRSCAPSSTIACSTPNRWRSER